MQSNLRLSRSISSFETGITLYFEFLVLIIVYVTPAAPLVWVYLTLKSLKSSDNAIIALLYSIFISFLNPTIFSYVSEQATIKLLFLFVAAGKILFAHFLVNSFKISKQHIFVLPYYFFAALSIVFSSETTNLDVSTFKFLNFVLYSSAIIVGFSNSKVSVKAWFSKVNTLVLSVVVLSAPLIILPQFSFARNGSGFQGLLNHPNAFGVIVAPLISLLTLKIFEKSDFTSKKLYSYLLFFLCCTLSIFSAARSSLIAAFLGVFSTFSIYLLANWNFKKFDFKIFLVAILIIFPIYILNLSSFSSNFSSFILKNTDQDSSISDVYLNSRGFLIDLSLKNFSENPILGIGFAKPSDPSRFFVERDSIFGLPLSAPTEKGMIISASLEETGILGTFALLFGIFWILKSGFKILSPNQFVQILTALLLNFSEMMFFSFSGLGLFIWIYLGIACCKGDESAI
jgi:O-Antigen ligase